MRVWNIQSRCVHQLINCQVQPVGRNNVIVARKKEHDPISFGGIAHLHATNHLFVKKSLDQKLVARVQKTWAESKMKIVWDKNEFLNRFIVLEMKWKHLFVGYGLLMAVIVLPESIIYPAGFCVIIYQLKNRIF